MVGFERRKVAVLGVSGYHFAIPLAPSIHPSEGVWFACRPPDGPLTWLGEKARLKEAGADPVQGRSGFAFVYFGWFR